MTPPIAWQKLISVAPAGTAMPSDVVLSVPDASNAYMQLSVETAERTAARLGLSLSVHYAQSDFTLQVRQLGSFMRGNQKPAIFMVIPVEESALKTLSEQALEAGIGWFWLNRSVGNEAELRSRFPKLPVSLFSPDQRQAGRVQARQVRGLLPEGGRALYVQGRMSNSSARLRAGAFHDELALPGPAIEIVAELDGGWSQALARDAVTRWLQVTRVTRQRPQAVICQNDSMAAGVLEALALVAKTSGDSDLTKVPVVGLDGLPGIGRQMVDDGLLAATTLLPVASEPAVAAAAAFIANGALPQAQTLLVPEPYPTESAASRRYSRAI